MEHTPCSCRATERIPSQEEMRDDKETFERSGTVAEPQMDITYCPLHAAAPALLEALEDLLSVLPPVSDAVVARRDKARIIVAQAKGTRVS